MPEPSKASRPKETGTKKCQPSAPSPRTPADNADGFFDALFDLLDTESDLVTNAEADPDVRAGMRRAIKSLKDMLASAQRFHGHRFSDGPERSDKTAVEARKLVHDYNKWFRNDPSLEMLKALTRISERTTIQPTVFDRKFASAARATLGVTLLHYVPFDNAFEESASTSSWSKRAFEKLCRRLDKMKSLSFNAPVARLLSFGGQSSGDDGVSPPKPKPGRPKTNEPDEAQILGLWKTGDYKSYTECADAVISPQPSKTPMWKRVKQVVVRDNKRRSRESKKKGA